MLWCRPQFFVIVFYTMAYQFCRFAEVCTSGVTVTLSTSAGGIKYDQHKSSPSMQKFTHKSSTSKHEMSQQNTKLNRKTHYYSPTKNISTHASQRKLGISISTSPIISKGSFQNLKLNKPHEFSNIKQERYYARTSFNYTGGEAQSDEARTGILIMTTVGIINGIIASTAALGMGGVVVSGLLLFIKVILKAMIILVGWIYVI